MKRKRFRGDSLYERLAAQLRWVEEHGGDEAGYVARYGAGGQPDCFGSGGEAIFAADQAALKNLIERAVSTR